MPAFVYHECLQHDLNYNPLCQSAFAENNNEVAPYSLAICSMVLLWALFVVPFTVSKQLMELYVQIYANKGGKAITFVPVIGSGVGNGLAGISTLTHRLLSLRICALHKSFQLHLV